MGINYEYKKNNFFNDINIKYKLIFFDEKNKR